MQNNQLNIVPDLSHRNVLLVEDDMFSSLYMQQLLKETGARPLVAFTGAEAIKLFQTYPVHLAFIDLRLPDMDGFEVAKIMREHHYSHLIIAISGNNNIDEEIYQHSHFDYHFDKPLRMEVLYSFLQEIYSF